MLGSKFGMGYLKFLKKDDILETEDSHIDVDTIIVKFSCPLFSFYFIFKISL